MENPFGNLSKNSIEIDKIENDLDFTENCYVIFIDLINDGKVEEGKKIDYLKARELFENPIKFMKKYKISNTKNEESENQNEKKKET